MGKELFAMYKIVDAVAISCIYLMVICNSVQPGMSRVGLSSLSKALEYHYIS